MGCALEAEGGGGGNLIVICLEGLRPEGQEMLQLTGNRLYNELRKGGMRIKRFDTVQTMVSI